MRCGEGEVRAGRRERAWGVVAAHKRHARGWPDPRLGGMRGAHVEHVAYVRDAGGVEAQRLVEGRRALPSRREGMQCGEGEVRAGRREGLRCVVAARQEACTGKRPDSRLNWGPRARAERTRNMPPMDLTLEVSKLSSWLKADEDCRVEGRAHAMRGRRGASREAGGPAGWWRHTSGMHGDGPTQGLGACAERTKNMKLMSVTLEVSKLSGWLKADAACRVEGRACDAGGERCEPGGGRARGEVAARQAACTGKRPGSRLGGQGHARSARRT